MVRKATEGPSDKLAQLVDLATQLNSLTAQPAGRGARDPTVRRNIKDLLDKALAAIRWLEDNAGQVQTDLGITGFTVTLGVLSIAADFRRVKKP